MPCKIAVIVRRWEAIHEASSRCRLFVRTRVLPSSASAQNWSDWITSNNHDVQYRWVGSTPSASAECHLQWQDLKRNQTTVVSVVIDYKAAEAESTRETVTISDPKAEDQAQPSCTRACRLRAFV